MHCSRRDDREDYYVPDIMFVLNNSGSIELKKKSCRCCGHKFPDEYGYYKMIPVTMLGSAYSAKTSFMLAMLWCVRNKPPFTRVSNRFRVTTLTNDDNLVEFEKINLSRYVDGLPPLKTEYEGVPILNFLANDVIYTFIDWPGEAFIYDSSKDVLDVQKHFAYDTRRIIQKSRHFICSLDPDQVTHGLGADYDEQNYYSETHLLNRFREHIGYVPTKYLRSVTFLANKFDLFANDSNASELNEMLSQITESSIYTDNGVWNNESWKGIVDATARLLKMKIPGFVTGVSTEYAKHNVCFIPSAPYGRTVHRNTGSSEGEAANQSLRAVNRGYMSGLPFLHILKSDGVIK